MRIIVVEDDKITGDNIVDELRSFGYAVDLAEDREYAEIALESHEYDFAILNHSLPDGCGIEFLKKLRVQGKEFPVLMLIANNDTANKVECLDSGADDCMTKPLEISELQARLRAIRRRFRGNNTPILKISDIELDPAAKKVTKAGEMIDLGPKELAILQILIENKGRIMSKEQLENAIYDWSTEIGSNTVEVHVHGLRKKLGKDVVETIKYLGYRIRSE